MVEAAYLERPYDREFEATVERVLDDRLVLSRTLFYPTGGGQPHDTGMITTNGRSFRVVDVEQRDRIYHTVAPGEGDGTEEDLPGEGTAVSGTVDWDRRAAHMRYHTAQHLLSALLLDEYDAPTTGNQLYADRARIDCAYDRFDADDITHIESRMNELVETGMDVTWQTMPRSEAEETLDPKRTRLDLLPDRITEVRIVEIDEFDRTACAGTHVTNTEEIGAVTIIGRETRGSDEERIRFELGD